MDEPYELMKTLFPICRSITGNGVRQSLRIIRDILSGLQIHEIPSGTQCFDWTVPNEWNIRQGWLANEQGERIVDFASNNLHIMGYSTPVDEIMDLDELEAHLYTLPEMPDAIPYVTSYYKERWGFCMSHNQKQQLLPGKYHAFIDSTLEPGALTYADLIIPGREEKEILLSTYICHPSLANDNLSGPCVLTYLGQWLQNLPDRKYTYRLVYIPETIGAIAYLSQHLPMLKERVIAGYVLTCMGDQNAWSFLPSRDGNTLSDRVARYVLKNHTPGYQEYTFLERGSDERQYCSPGIDLPIASIMRSKYGTFPQYHTSEDHLGYVSPEGLQESLEIYKRAVEIIEKNGTYKTICLCEPQMGKRGLYPTISSKKTMGSTRDMMNLLAFADGTHDLLELSQRLSFDFFECYLCAKRLEEAGLLETRK